MEGMWRGGGMDGGVDRLDCEEKVHNGRFGALDSVPKRDFAPD